MTQFSEILKYHRYRAGITQSELANSSGVALVTIKKIEGGHSIVRPKTLQALADALKIPADALSKVPRRLRTIRFRACRNMRSKEGLINRIIQKLDTYNEIENSAGSFLEEKYKTLKMFPTPVENAINCRKLLGLDLISPVADITHIMSLLGLKLFSEDVNTDKFFSLSVGEEDGGPAIIINSNENISYEQAVFSIAHELGHFIMHQNKYAEINDEIIWEEEDAADLFASHFLMPEEGFLRYWNANLGLCFSDRVIKVKHIFSVHYKTVLYRLGSFEHYRDKFLQEYNGGIKSEKDPEPIGKKLFVESRLLELVKKATEKKKFSFEKARKLGINVR